MACPRIHLFLRFGQKVDQNCAYCAVIQRVRYPAISGTMAAAAATVRKKNNPACARWQRQIGVKLDTACGYANFRALNIARSQ